MALRAEDLMIGDWIQRAGFPFQVRKFNLEEVSSKDWVFEIKYCDPVPIIPEILVKNGFEMKPDGDGQHDRFTLVEGHTSFSLKYARSVFQWLNPIDFKYVHQLQHALRMCGIEKEIII